MNKNIYEIGDSKSEMVTSQMGLRQGCPLSPSLFIIYLSKLEEKLQRTGTGYKMKEYGNSEGGCTITGLFYADDIVLFSSKLEDMQVLLDKTAEFGEESQLEFSAEKSKIMIMRDGERKEEERLNLGNIQMELVKEYTYLGVILSNEEKYLETHIGRVEKKLGKYLGIIKTKAYH